MRAIVHIVILLILAVPGTGCLSTEGRIPSLLGGSKSGNSDLPAIANELSVAGEPKELPNPDSARLCYKMATQLERDGKEVDAILYFEQARQLDASLRAESGRRLAVLYDRADEQARALVEYQELLKLHPDDPALHNDVGYSYYNRGAWTDAERHLRKAVAIDRANKRAWVNLGLTLAQQGRDQEAIDAFLEAVTPAEAYANLGFILSVRGRRHEAIAAYQRALEFEPTLKGAREAIARIETGPAASAITPTAAQGNPAIDASRPVAPDAESGR